MTSITVFFPFVTIEQAERIYTVAQQQGFKFGGVHDISLHLSKKTRLKKLEELIGGDKYLVFMRHDGQPMHFMREVSSRRLKRNTLMEGEIMIEDEEEIKKWLVQNNVSAVKKK